MESAQYIGRKVIKRVVKSLLSAAFGKTGAHGDDGAVPRLFLLHGANGAGKSTLIDICMQGINELGATNGRPAAWALVDLDDARFRTGMLPATPGAMIDAIVKAAAASHERIATQLSLFERMRLKIDDINWKKQLLTDTEWPRELFLNPLSNEEAANLKTNGNPAATNSSASIAKTRFDAWIRTKIDPGDLALAALANKSLTALLADCLVNASLKIPFALIIDGMELASNEVELWLRDTFLPFLVKRDSGIAIILSGGSNCVRSFRNAFAERTVFSCPLSALSPDVFRHRGIGLGQEHCADGGADDADEPLDCGERQSPSNRFSTTSP